MYVSFDRSVGGGGRVGWGGWAVVGPWGRAGVGSVPRVWVALGGRLGGWVVQATIVVNVWPIFFAFILALCP